jgi:hypothetical protein
VRRDGAPYDTKKAFAEMRGPFRFGVPLVLKTDELENKRRNGGSVRLSEWVLFDARSPEERNYVAGRRTRDDALG